MLQADGHLQSFSLSAPTPHYSDLSHKVIQILRTKCNVQHFHKQVNQNFRSFYKNPKGQFQDPLLCFFPLDSILVIFLNRHLYMDGAFEHEQEQGPIVVDTRRHPSPRKLTVWKTLQTELGVGNYSSIILLHQWQNGANSFFISLLSYN